MSGRAGSRLTPAALVDRIRDRDPGLAALRRASRAAIVMPACFALSDVVIGNGTMALFAAFGALSTLLFVDFGGEMRARVTAQALLVASGAVLVTAGTLASHSAWLAVAGTVVVAFAVSFAGIVSSALASATSALLVAFVLAVAVPADGSPLPDRLAGFLLSGAASVLAIRFLWPAPVRDPLRAATAGSCTRLAARVRAEVALAADRADPARRAAAAAAGAEARDAVAALRRAFFATPYRPTGLTTASRVLVRAVDQTVWMDAILERMPPDRARGGTGPAICAIKLAAAELLEGGARLLDDPADEPPGLPAARARLVAARAALRRDSAPLAGSAATGPATGLVGALDPGFRAQELSFAATMIADTIGLAAAARRRRWWELLLGRDPAAVSASFVSARARLAAHLRRGSVWLHNSLRAAAALGLAVLLIEVVRIDHSFWVVFGTLAILRSSALSTGQDAARALAGTAAGLAIGGTLTVLLGEDTTAYWVALPPAVLFAGLAPAAISFAAGQAGFTIVLMVLYGIIAPAGWTTGLVRVEDVAIGSAVSVLVGALFWPRGAGAQLGRALAGAYGDAGRALRTRIEAALAPEVTGPAVAAGAAQEAAASARRLDDALRTFLADRGAKRVSYADVTTLVNGVAVLRLTASAIAGVWEGATPPRRDGPSAARDEVVAAGRGICGWYAEAARALAGLGPMPAARPAGPADDARLLDAARRDLDAGEAAETVVGIVWTADHTDVARRLQGRLAGPAAAVATLQRRSRPARAAPAPSGDVRAAAAG
jgi:fusaric acid resistance family protein